MLLTNGFPVRGRKPGFNHRRMHQGQHVNQWIPRKGTETIIDRRFQSCRDPLTNGFPVRGRKLSEFFCELGKLHG